MIRNTLTQNWAPVGPTECYYFDMFLCFKWTYGLSGNKHRVLTLFKLYQTLTVIKILSLKKTGQF